MPTRLNRSGLDPVWTSPGSKVMIVIRFRRAVDHRAWPGCSPGRRADRETTRRQSSSVVFLSSLSSTANTPASWDVIDDTTCAGIHDIASRLLQLSAGWPPARYARAVAALCPKRSCAINPRPQPVGLRQSWNRVSKTDPWPISDPVGSIDILTMVAWWTTRQPARA